MSITASADYSCARFAYVIVFGIISFFAIFRLSTNSFSLGHTLCSNAQNPSLSSTFLLIFFQKEVYFGLIDICVCVWFVGAF